MGFKRRMCDTSTSAWDLKDLEASGHTKQGYIPPFMTVKDAVHVVCI